MGAVGRVQRLRPAAAGSSRMRAGAEEGERLLYVGADDGAQHLQPAAAGTAKVRAGVGWAELLNSVSVYISLYVQGNGQ